MRDLTYVKLIFFGKKLDTELADAKYDGKINPLDFIQIKLIIVGKEKEITFIDSCERTVTVNKPLKRIVVLFSYTLELLRSIGVEENQIVGVESQISSSEFGGTKNYYKIYFPDYQDKPTLGDGHNPDCEAILNLHPDAVFLCAIPGREGNAIDVASDVLESAGITVLRFHGGVGGRKVPEEVIKLGYLFDKQKAEKFLDWYEGILNPIKEKVEKISEENKPKVYFESWKPYTAYSAYAFIERAGGKDILPNARGSIDPEAVIDRDPDIIIKMGFGDGYYADARDTTVFEETREEIMNRPELQNVKAVKEGRVYVFSGYLVTYMFGSSTDFLQIAYFAKWFHPDLFKDLDPKAIHQEYLTRFQGLDFDLDEKGVFVYPEPS
jgi:iron complex transport system substrate-binding protein